MKIGIIGASGAELVAMRAVMKKMIHEVVVICEDDISESKTIAVCGNPLSNLGIDCFPVEARMPDIDNSFRGGSRGKGGKTKYRRT